MPQCFLALEFRPAPVYHLLVSLLWALKVNCILVSSLLAERPAYVVFRSALWLAHLEPEEHGFPFTTLFPTVCPCVGVTVRAADS